MFHIPTQIVSGSNCLLSSADDIQKLGFRRVYVVTSRTAGQRSGALDDVRALCERLRMPMEVFDQIGQNPAIEDCQAAGRRAGDFGADCLIGIGGGSPLDAAKAAAAFAVRPDMPMMELFAWENAPTLPLLAIPTTAGTGSEVNAISVLTVDGGDRKQTFKTPQNFPRMAFLDPRYTAALPRQFALSTALDALCHAVESYLTPFSTPVTEALTLRAARDAWATIHALASGDLDEDGRLRMLEAACMAGMAIQHTGTGMPHPMGYALSLHHGLPHGAACALFLPAHLEMLKQAVPGRVEAVLAALETDLGGLSDTVAGLHGFRDVLTEAQMAHYVETVAAAPNLRTGHVKVPPPAMMALYRQLPAVPKPTV